MLGWFRALMPREEHFFELFTRHSQVTVAGAVALRALLTGSKDVAQCCKEISQREAEADELTREVLTALRRTFITPLDRGDIKDLITSMDDAIDQMNQTARTITLFERRPAFDIPGVGLGQPANALRVYDTLGVLEEVLATGFSYDRMWLFDAQRRPIVEHKFLMGDERIPAFCALSRLQLHEILLGV